MARPANAPTTDSDLYWPLLVRGPLLLGVSGGADSMAMLHLAVKAGVPVRAVTVDHGLRAESAAEAAGVHAFCAGLGVPHDIVRVDVTRSGNIQAAARTARYRALAAAGNRLGIAHIATAHTADDQAETVLMRLRRGQAEGLSAMPFARFIATRTGAPVVLFRPFLDFRRARLRAYAEAHRLPFVDDRGNDDPQFERVRLRGLLAGTEALDLLQVKALCALAADAAAIDAERAAARAARATAYNLSIEADGAIRLAHWPTTPDPVDLALLRQAVLAVGRGSASRSASRNAVERAAYRVPALLAGPHAGPPLRSTLAGAVLCREDDGALLILREPAALLGRADAGPGAAPVAVEPSGIYDFDRRFRVHIPANVAPATTLLPLGALLPAGLATSTLARARIATLPVLASGGRLTHLPAGCDSLVSHALGGWKDAGGFLSSVDVCLTEPNVPERFASAVIRF